MSKNKEVSELEKQILDQFMSGQNLFGEGGALAPMLKNVIEKALEAEMEAHLDSEERFKGNKRNGKGKKTLKSRFGRTLPGIVSHTFFCDIVTISFLFY